MKLRTFATGLTNNLPSFCSIEIKSNEEQNENKSNHLAIMILLIINNVFI